jgi:hypothetical protein
MIEIREPRLDEAAALTHLLNAHSAFSSAKPT